MESASRLRLTLAIALCALVATGIAAVAALALAKGGADETVYAVTLADGRIELASTTLPPGRHVMDVTNVGSEEHEIVTLRTDRPADGLAVGLHGVSIEHSGELVLGEDHAAMGHGHGAGEVLGLLPGQSRRHQVKLQPGRYVVFCQTSNHYLSGDEFAEFSVG
jgi:hypothetical protein